MSIRKSSVFRRVAAPEARPFNANVTTDLAPDAAIVNEDAETAELPTEVLESQTADMGQEVKTQLPESTNVKSQEFQQPDHAEILSVPTKVFSKEDEEAARLKMLELYGAAATQYLPGADAKATARLYADVPDTAPLAPDAPVTSVLQARPTSRGSRLLSALKEKVTVPMTWYDKWQVKRAAKKSAKDSKGFIEASAAKTKLNLLKLDYGPDAVNSDIVEAEIIDLPRHEPVVAQDVTDAETIGLSREGAKPTATFEQQGAYPGTPTSKFSSETSGGSAEVWDEAAAHELGIKRLEAETEELIKQFPPEYHGSQHNDTDRPDQWRGAAENPDRHFKQFRSIVMYLYDHGTFGEGNEYPLSEDMDPDKRKHYQQIIDEVKLELEKHRTKPLA